MVIFRLEVNVAMEDFGALQLFTLSLVLSSSLEEQVKI